MTPELQNKLVNEYPEFFKGIGKSPQESCLAFGFECDDGWYFIIETCCSLIKHHYKNKKEIDFEFLQVKEKFGTLRLYHQGGDDFVSGVVDMAEALSSSVCEVTGNPGKLHVRNTWYKTLCENEANKLGFERYTK
jgi:hypothetical protein